MRVNFLTPLERPTLLKQGANVHESVFRSWHILDVVLWLLEQKVPQDVVHAYIIDMRSADGKEETYGD